MLTLRAKKAKQVTHEEFASAVEALRRLESKLDYADEELVDAVIYEIKAAELRLSYLLKLARVGSCIKQ